ncbi:ParB/RepB/Spo0J family partition protein [Peribacillus frigoritolerans]|uniref:ParB/RepB/Spo0J family partition protein n=1 Tax=Peribacillus frigoritolerans TaxID=450367 RepID=UPI00207A0184|nr:ParB/RepB/Spo0J family partition protein [Peribacillus frigoritolerans]USK77741.1 ParB/RepB/Spo0J family partition protein [Peribacillus frigoritolerans]USK77821.1 ParB/RepB/Spo0J family partition protein [Peribacillus frigoritolerans]
MVVEQTQQITELNAKLSGGFKIAVVPVEKLEFLEKNARFMKNETFQNLVANIKKDGGLSQLPFCYLQENGKYKVLSGNHRSQAAISAGLTEIPLLYTDKELSKDEQLAIQLSHNSISGEDDPIILQQLYDEIDDLSLKYYAGLDDKMLEQLDKIQVDGISEAQLDFLSVSFLFLPNEAEHMLNVIERAKEEMTSKTILARYSEYDRLLDAQEKTQTSFDVHNGATSLMVILDIFERHQEDLQSGFLDEEDNALHKKTVPLSSVFGTDYIPAESLAVIKKAVDKMLSSGDIEKTKKWEALEYWAVNHLSGE